MAISRSTANRAILGIMATMVELDRDAPETIACLGIAQALGLSMIEAMTIVEVGVRAGVFSRSASHLLGRGPKFADLWADYQAHVKANPDSQTN
jgi:hypothetical protein